MGLDVYYYKMRQPKTEAEVKNALHENGVDDFLDKNVEKRLTNTIIEKRFYPYGTMPRQYAYGRKIWETLDQFSRSENVERCWDLLDRDHIQEMHDLSIKVAEESTEEFDKQKYTAQAQQFALFLSAMNEGDQAFVYYSY